MSEDRDVSREASTTLDEMPRASTTKNAGQPLTLIDLFAGCGGLSLGLEQSGFHPLLFSEINPSAAETYIVNRKGMDFIPIGDIYKLSDVNLELCKTYWKHKGICDVDLVCGGPPCQGYSGIGHRRTFKLAKKDIPSNHLFEEMIRVIRVIRPKAFLFENVRGLLNSRWTPDGEKGEVFKAVLAAFSKLDCYRIRWDLLHAKDYGVPQNRPRVLMVGIREDVLAGKLSGQLFSQSGPSAGAVEAGFLPRAQDKAPTLVELLSDLVDPEFLGKEATLKYPNPPKTAIQRMLRRTREGTLADAGDPVSDHEYSNHAPYIREKFAHMIANKGEIPAKFRTKKFAQRVFPTSWKDSGPNITATSLPDDYVHYEQPRAPTVREWARIQTFPDWYQFCGPRTTGGRRRAGDPSIGSWERDVPKFTQIGNAVPVFLAWRIGQHLAGLLRDRRSE